MADITVTFADGTSHVYQNAPDTLTPDDVQARASKDFGKPIVKLDRARVDQGGQTAPQQMASQIPGQVSTSQARPEPTMQDKIMGYVEAPAIVAGNIGRLVANPIARMYGEAVGGYGTPQGRQAGEQMAKTVSDQFYQPRTETGPEVVETMAKVLGSVPPTPLTSAGTALSTLAGPAARQATSIAAQASPTVQKMAALLRAPEPKMQGMGAASVDEALARQTRAREQGIRLTKGEQTGDLGQLQFESDIPKEKPELAKALIQFKESQKSDILKRFEQLSNQTGAEYADPDAYRKIGSLVDKNVAKQFDDKKLKVDQAYQAARDAGETKQVIDTAPLEKWLADNAPEGISVPQIQTIAAKLDALKKSTGGQITIDDIENLYQAAGSLSKPGEQSAVYMGRVKGVINDMTEGAGGDLYRAARTQRKELDNDFENTYRVAKLLGTRGGYADRAVALDDVFSHVVLDGSLEEMRTVTTLLKKGGAEGRQAYAELQGQTIQYLKDQLTKNSSGKLSFAKLNNAIETLDREEKLTYMFGKKGRETLVELRDAIKDAVVKPEGTVNYSNTGNVVLRGLDKLAKMHFPLAKTASEMAETSALTKQVNEAVNYDALTKALTK
jgi:hypothetical protein